MLRVSLLSTFTSPSPPIVSFCSYDVTIRFFKNKSRREISLGLKIFFFFKVYLMGNYVSITVMLDSISCFGIVQMCVYDDLVFSLEYFLK